MSYTLTGLQGGRWTPSGWVGAALEPKAEAQPPQSGGSLDVTVEGSVGAGNTSGFAGDDEVLSPSSSSLLFSNQELSDTKVCERRTQAFLGTTAHFCKAVVLKLRSLRFRVQGFQG